VHTLADICNFVGEGARSAIQTAAILIGTRQHVRTLAAAPHPHPSISEAVQECVRMALGCSLHKDHLTPDSRSYVRVFRPQQVHVPYSATHAATPTATSQQGHLSDTADTKQTSSERKSLDALEQGSSLREPGSADVGARHGGARHDEHADDNKSSLVPNYLT